LDGGGCLESDGCFRQRDGELTDSLLFLIVPALRLGGSRTAIQSHGRQSRESPQ